MNDRPWRERVAAEDALQRDLRDQMSRSAQRRAEALRDGVDELGSNVAVAEALGVTEKAIRKAIARAGLPATGPATPPTE